MSEHSAPLRMALRDYRARARFPVLAVCAVVLALLPGLGAFRGDPDAQRYGYIVGTPLLMMWVGLVSGHLKLILARPETRLVPGVGRRLARLRVEGPRPRALRDRRARRPLSRTGPGP